MIYRVPILRGFWSVTYIPTRVSECPRFKREEVVVILEYWNVCDVGSPLLGWQPSIDKRVQFLIKF